MTGGASPRARRWLAVDYGERRVGLAVSDPSGTIASPAGFILRRPGKRPPIAEIIRRAGGQVYAQDQATSVVWGMPGAVATSGQADKILPLPQIGGALAQALARTPRAAPAPAVGAPAGSAPAGTSTGGTL